MGKEALPSSSQPGEDVDRGGRSLGNRGKSTATATEFVSSAPTSSASSSSLDVPSDWRAAGATDRESGEVNDDRSITMGEDSDGCGSDGGDNMCVTTSPARAPLVKQERFRHSSSIPETMSARINADGSLKDGDGVEQSRGNEDGISHGEGDRGEVTSVRMESDDQRVSISGNKNVAWSTTLDDIATGISALISIAEEGGLEPENGGGLKSRQRF